MLVSISHIDTYILVSYNLNKIKLLVFRDKYKKSFVLLRIIDIQRHLVLLFIQRDKNQNIIIINNIININKKKQ